MEAQRERARRSTSVNVDQLGPRIERLPMVPSARYRTAGPTLSERWRSFRSKQRKSSVEGANDGDVEDEEEAIGADQSPPSDDYGFFESLDGGIEEDLSVRLCKDSIRSNLTELLRAVSSSGTTRLEDMEAGRLQPAACSPAERNVCLLWACFLGRVEVARALLAAGADPGYSEPSDNGLGPLHLAAFSGAVECCRLLIETGAPVNAVHRAFAPLHCAVIGNAVDTARLLLRHGASPSLCQGDSPSPLHCAVRAGAVDCVQLLLEAGADPRRTQADGWTALHIAADRGSQRCIKLLLDAGADVSARTVERLATPLHLAAEGGSVEAVRLLLGSGADSSARTSRGQTPLHLAARAQSLDSVELLLGGDGCADPNAADHDQRTPLHAAVGKALVAFDMVEMLLKWGARVNACDKYGYSPLHVAALNELSQCVETLLYHGADLSARTRGGTSALSIIARKTPASLGMLAQRLDAAISMHDPEAEVSHREVELKLDFRPVLQHCRHGETSFLKAFVDEEGQKHFLQHPLCQAFLHLKWQKVRKLYACRLALWGVFTALLTLYVLTALAHNCYNEGRGVQPYPSTAQDFCKNNSMIGRLLMENPAFIEAEWYVLVALAFCEVLRKVHGIAGYFTIRQYFTQSDNIIEWLVLASVPVISFIYAGKTFMWQNHVGAFAVLFAWTNMMVMIGQLPVFGTYVAMYTRVQTEVTKLLLAYACLLIGFTITFCVMFPAAQTFSNPFVGIIKVLVMMTGELDFEDLLFGDTSAGNPPLLLSVSAHLTFVMFLLSVTIVLMNLMVGIAVHDIQGLKKTATLSKLVRQTNLISHIERALFNGYLPSHLLRLLRRSALVSPSGYRVVLHVKPLNPRETRLPKPVLAAAYQVARQRHRGSTNKHTINSQRTSWNTYLPPSAVNELAQEVRDIREALRDLLTALEASGATNKETLT